MAVVPPLATFTDAGTDATLVLELLSVTTAPAAGAGPFSVTVPVTVSKDPPTTVDEETDTLASAGF